MEARRLYLISYDIADPHRLARVARCLEHDACRVQYSVFVGEFRRAELEALLARLARLIEPRADDIRAYPLPGVAEVALLGRQMFADEVMLLRDGRNVLRLGSAAHPPRRNARQR